MLEHITLREILTVAAQNDERLVNDNVASVHETEIIAFGNSDFGTVSSQVNGFLNVFQCC